jgi:hypothetical protein
MEKKMKTNIIKILWGIVLIAVGGLFLVDRLGYVDLDLLTRLDWSIVFTVTSAFFFVCYLLAGVRQWGWLFPALLFAALALIVGVLVDNHSDEMIAMTILLSLGIPFYVGYLLDRKQWGLLIPAWVMTVISVIPALSESPNSDLIGAIVLYAIALPFIFVFLVSRQRKWALIVGLVLAFIGLFPLIGPILPDAIAGPVVMSLFFLFFLAIYVISKKSWWALIPAGIFLSIGVVALLDILLPSRAYVTIGGLDFGVYTGVLFLGFAITFGVLWLLRGSLPTAWAKYPAIVLLIVSISAFLMWQTTSDLVPAITLVVVGVALILGSVLKRRGSHQLTSRQP